MNLKTWKWIVGLISGGLGTALMEGGEALGRKAAENPDSSLGHLADGLGKVFTNVASKYGETGLTDRDIAMNDLAVQNMHTQAEIDRELRRTEYQDRMAGAAEAGINPYFALGASVNSPAVSAPSTPAAGNHGDLGSLVSTIGSLMMAFSGSRRNTAEAKLLEAQKDNVHADTEVKEKTAGNLAATTAGIILDNEWKKRTLDARSESENLRNDLTRKQISEIDKGIERADHEIANLDEQARAFGAKAMLDNITAYRLVALLPYEQAYQEAATAERKAAATEHYAASEAHKASAAYSLVAAMYQQRVIDSGIIEENARLVGLDADVKDIEKALADWDYNVKTGDPNGLITQDKFSQFVLSTAATFGALRQATGISIGLGGNVSYGRSTSTSTSTSTIIK